MTLDQSPIALELSYAEALVLFELTSRFSKTDQLAIEHRAEERALWDICCQLERVLAEPSHRDYRELLAAARDEVADDGSA